MLTEVTLAIYSALSRAYSDYHATVAYVLQRSDVTSLPPLQSAAVRLPHHAPDMGHTAAMPSSTVCWAQAPPKSVKMTLHVYGPRLSWC